MPLLDQRPRCLAPLLAAAIIYSAAASQALAVNDVAGDLILFNNNGAWSWFEDERAIVDVAAGKIIVSSVANSSGTGGAARHGDVEVASYDLSTGELSQFTLHDGLQADDHNSAALWQRTDGRYVALYAKHGSDQLTRFRISTNPGDVTSWSPEQTFSNGAGATYSNLHYLPNDNNGAGRLYNFVRSVNFDPNILVSNDQGSSWSYGGRLLSEGGSGDRPYLRYYSKDNRIHLIATERHPRNYDNGIYHGSIENGRLYGSAGNLLDGNLFDSSAVAPAALTPIFIPGTQFNGVTMRRAWTIDVAIDDAGLPYALFQARANDSNLDHRFFYARFDGSAWSVNELAKAGGYLYAAEDDYTGLGALDPNDPNRLFISTKIDPRTDVAMPRYEIFEGVTTNSGVDWNWKPITFNSVVDNLRPIVPAWDNENTALLWMRGSYSTYTNYNLDVVGLTDIGEIVPRIAGDLDGDGDVDLDDVAAFVDGLHADLSALSYDEARRRGDLNGDLVNDYQDFLLFRQAYDLAHGAGSTAAAMASVPEPVSLFSALAAGVGAMTLRRATKVRSVRELQR